MGIGTAPRLSLAQACCAGGTAVTPGRLALHEDALVGLQVRAAAAVGSYDATGRYSRSPTGDSETDLEQDVFGAIRIAGRGQWALLVPIVETTRSTPQDGTHWGGGLGDVNASARYDFVQAGESRAVPGLALLGGLTLPTGRSPDAAVAPLAVDATGVGAFQGSLAIALEQTFGPWLVNATAIAAKRLPHGGETLGTQFTLLAAGAYTFSGDEALALSVSYSFEGNASSSDGSAIPSSSKRLTTITLAGLWPLTDTWRLQGGIFVDPPASGCASNQPAYTGLTATMIRAWL
ncbi:MAG: hypothetical protein ABTD50_08265 [Polyangiaceae bacterium]